MAKSTTVLQKVVLVLHALTATFLFVAAGMIYNVYSRPNYLIKGNQCPLYYSSSNISPTNAACIFSICGEVFAGVGVLILVILIVTKTYNIIKQ